MHPVLFEIPFFGGIPLFSYGVLVATGFLVGSFWVKHEAARVGISAERAMDLLFYIIIAALVGSRVLHILVADLDRVLENPLVLFKIWEGGLVFYGGLIGALLVATLYVRRHHLPWLIYADAFSPAIPLGHAIGRLGCFMAGCCYGKPVDGHPWYAVIFPHVERSFAPAGIPLYPTQLMESGAELIVFGILFFLRRYKRFQGQVMATYLMLYAVVRSTIELFRGDLERGFIFDPWLSTSQGISILIFAVGVSIYFWRWKRRDA